MPEFRSRWLTFSPDTGTYRAAKTDKRQTGEPAIFPETGQCATDKTDKSPSVSFVSSIVDHSQKNFPPSGLPCGVCGACDWHKTPEAGRWCLPCVLAGRVPVVAVKVHSAVLDAAIWVVADDLPREQWPADALVFTHGEAKILTQVGRDTLAWVHATKQMFGAQVVRGGWRLAPAAGDASAEEEAHGG